MLHHVKVNVAGERLDRFVADYLGRSRTRVQALIADGLVSVEPAPSRLTASTTLREGDTVTIDDEPEPVAPVAEPEDIPLDILHEDDAVLVLNKPAGLVVHPAAGHAGGTLVNALMHHCGGALARRGGTERLGIVHRLDKDTSGVMVVAKTDDAHEALGRQFAARTIGKIYLAISKGLFKKPRGTIDNAIGRHPIHRKKMAVRPATASGARPAHTDYVVQRQLGYAALVECVLHTGRTHQIRVHLAHVGHPILGDTVYGRAPKLPAGVEPPTRQLLHAARLAFDHPVTGNRVEFSAPVPHDFTSFLEALAAAEEA